MVKYQQQADWIYLMSAKWVTQYKYMKPKVIQSSAQKGRKMQRQLKHVNYMCISWYKAVLLYPVMINL